ncbi:MAG: hypothetical protein BZY79_06545 [SAR202 cluster bacterium Casp-Chloro-G4]|nr:helix-turn-helix transcriptional regulator [Chloroflexota bacterium]MDA1226833.1 helix-turn-helix transcriptional regulator [Chloroflexota bacterium]PKB60877.1 MAG: hypothetical protein BZY79_06545 [SAR202 cluster bacterium Casp-Chloro-G4]
MTTLKEKQLFESFQDKDYRDTFVQEHIGVGLAYQIRAMREKFGWTQEEFARRAGKRQEVISQLENPDYGSYTLKTLKILASAFDVALQVNFVSFRDLIRNAANLTPEIIAPPSYDEERQMTFAGVHETTDNWWESDTFIVDDDLIRDSNLSAYSADALAVSNFATTDVETPQQIRAPRKRGFVYEAA